MIRITSSAAALILSLGLATGTLAEPPTTAELSELNRTFVEWTQSAAPEDRRDRAKMQEQVEAIYGDLNFAELDVAGIRTIRGYARMSPELNQKISDRLDVLGAQEDAEGAAAAALLLGDSMHGQPEEVRDAFLKVLNHPGFDEAMASGSARDVFGALRGLRPEAGALLKEELLGLADVFSADDAPADVMMMGSTYISGLERAGIDAADREAARVQVASAMKRAMSEAENEATVKSLKKQLAFVDGAFARGELIDHEAPEINFTWGTPGLQVSKLSDLKGKVVVLDYWATWCGPCVASFPKIRELQKKYDGYDVVVIGVTSLQGRHYPKMGAEAITTTDDPEREYELMGEYVTDQDINWQIAFSEQDVFNGEYGVQGIPHMTIIDAEGKVRYNGLHPGATSLEEKSTKINGLLKEAGLAHPQEGDTAVDDDGGGSSR
ncbi:MAG: TlpA family protein disulfide reductase [Phycisphaerales bacterium]